MTTSDDLVTRYLQLGLRLGRLVEGLVDAYYGPPELAGEIENEPTPHPGDLVADANELLTHLDVGEGDLDEQRQTWLRAQVVGLQTTAVKLFGTDIPYVDEVEACYGVRPRRIAEDEIVAAHERLDGVLPGTGDLRERYIAWREGQAIATDKLRTAIDSIADDFRSRTDGLFGLPAGERVDFELVSNEPWSGFNYYLGELRSRVAINTDLPVLATSLGHLVAHEAYPGHHTEHTRKEAGLVCDAGQLEETLFLVGTPQCLLAEGLADLGIEILLRERPEAVVAEHLRPLGIPFDAEVAALVREAGEVLSAVRGNLAFLLHEDHADVSEVIAYAERWMLQPGDRAQKAVEFLTSPTWRAYISCYVEGLPLCRQFVAGDRERFERLLTEQLVPADLKPA